MKYTWLVFICVFVCLSSCSTKQTTDDNVSDETSNSTAADAELPLQEKASTSYLFTTDDPDIVLVSFLPLIGHTLKVGDELDGINSANVRVHFSITKITGENNETKQELKTGEEGSISIKRLEGNISDLNGDFYFVDKDATFPTVLAQASESPSTNSGGSVSLILNGKAWPGSIVYQGALYYKGGVKMFDPSGKPYFQLAFKSDKAPDDRQFTITIKDFPGTVGQVSTEGMELLLSGSETGDTKKPEMVGYKNDSNHAGYSVQLVITNWEMPSSNLAKMSATFTAKLKGVFGSSDVVVSEGKLENVEVTVYTDKY